MAIKYSTVDEYISSFPKNVQEKLTGIREVVRRAAPDAYEAISYGMPAFKQNGIILWYAAAKNHYALYIVPEVKIKFKEKLAGYEQTKSAVKIPYNQPVPSKLITEITKYKLNVNIKKKLS